MTKRKLILLSTIRKWQPIIAQMVDLLLKEPARTNGQGARAKIRLKLPITYKPPKKWPKCVMVDCPDPNFEIREWRVVTLIAWCKSLGLSQWDASDIYKKRMSILSSMRTLEKELDLDEA